MDHVMQIDNKMLAVVGLLLLVKCTLQQNFTLSQPATGPSITCQGSDVTLQCVILRNGVPVDIVWRRNGTIVDNDILTNHQVVLNSTYNANTDLVITNVGLEDDNTEYQCRVVNSNITSSIVLNVEGPPSITNMSYSTSVCSVSLEWSSSRDEICGPISYRVLIDTNDETVKNISTNNPEALMVNLVPNTDYTFEIVAMDTTGGVSMNGTFSTDMSVGESVTLTWQCNDNNTCYITANWTTTIEHCSPIVQLGLEGHNNSGSSSLVENNLPTNTTKTYTAMLTVHQMVTNATVTATYDGGVTRNSEPTIPIVGHEFLLRDLQAIILFNKQITITAKWRGAINLGITYTVSLTCNINRIQQNKTIRAPLTVEFLLPQDVITDNISCEVVVLLDNLWSINETFSENRMSSSSSSDYCEDNPGVCIGVPIVVVVTVLVVLVIVIVLLNATCRARLALLHQKTETSFVHNIKGEKNEYITVTERNDVNLQSITDNGADSTSLQGTSSGDIDTSSPQDTGSAVATTSERVKYTQVAISENLPIHFPGNHLVSYAEVQH
ncbi:uncharacterized protein [Dysidea avara]|uniref:uncharacterized protein isoform X2 n=1 Tax=Dysidea avara TaxID=196820 RepID=UPI00333414A5